MTRIRVARIDVGPRAQFESPTNDYRDILNQLLHDSDLDLAPLQTITQEIDSGATRSATVTRIQESLREWLVSASNEADVVVLDLTASRASGELYDAIALLLPPVLRACSVLLRVKSNQLLRVSVGFTMLAQVATEHAKSVWSVDDVGSVATIAGAATVDRIKLHQQGRADAQQQIVGILNAAGQRYEGHFEIPSKLHVRTLLSLDVFEHEVKVFAHLKEKLQALHAETKFDLIVGVGERHEVLSRVGVPFGSGVNSEYVHIHEPNLRSKVGDGNHSVLVLTDVVYSGATVRDALKRLAKLRIKTIGVFALVSAKPIRTVIKGVRARAFAELDLLFWAADCELCKLDYPLVTTGIREFFENPPAPHLPVHPYDFFSLVSHSNAWQGGHTITLNRNHYSLFINTSRVFADSGDRIATAIAAQIYQDFPLTDVHALVCPSDDPTHAAVQLATAISEAISRRHGRSHQKRAPAPLKVCQITREQLSRSDWDPSELKVKNKNVILVDDCVNTLHTYERLRSVCVAAGASVLGFAVFVNRLPISSLFPRTGRDPLFYCYYKWPVPPWSAQQCPICNA